MHISIKLPNISHINTKQLAEFAFIMYFANSLLRTIFSWLLGGTGALTVLCSLALVYIPVLLLCIVNHKKYIKIDFIILMLWILLFLSVTLAFHSEYKYYYLREDYGVWDHILIPYRGIYAYLFIRLIDDPKRIIKCMKISGWLMFFQFAYRIYGYLRRGYWYGVSGSNSSAEFSYNISFGYEVLLFTLVFLYCALKEKKMPDIVASIIGTMMILVAGSRGPVLVMAIFFVLYILMEMKYSRKKMLLISGIILVSILLYFSYTYILLALSKIITRFGFSSRFITSLMSGTISNDSGRSRIWGAAIDMIKQNPWGYGALGTRPVISNIIVAGYPHSVILEILVDYGVFIGGGILIVFLVNSIEILFTKKRSEWSGVFLIFFSSSCSLFLSLTYWSIPSFWATIGIGVCCHRAVKKKNKTKMMREGRC